MAFPTELVFQVLPLLASAFAPYVTEGVKKGVEFVGAKVPKVAKPVLSILAGAALSALVGGDPIVGGGAGLAATLGFNTGKNS